MKECATKYLRVTIHDNDFWYSLSLLADMLYEIFIGKVKDGYKVCEKHYQMNMEKARSQKAKEARKELQESGILYYKRSNRPWKDYQKSSTEK